MIETADQVCGASDLEMAASQQMRVEIGESIERDLLFVEVAPRVDHAVVEAVVRLLESADRALSRREEEARRYIAKATALLQAEHELRETQARDRQLRPVRGGLARWQLRRVVEFIESNLRTTIRMGDLASRTGLSTSYFFHAFRSSVGESPYAYLVRRRIERAQELMRKTDAPLCEIALECGLADQPHLTRLFRRLVGTSPAAWRRLIRQGELP